MDGKQFLEDEFLKELATIWSSCKGLPITDSSPFSLSFSFIFSITISIITITIFIITIIITLIIIIIMVDWLIGFWSPYCVPALCWNLYIFMGIASFQVSMRPALTTLHKTATLLPMAFSMPPPLFYFSPQLLSFSNILNNLLILVIVLSSVLPI